MIGWLIISFILINIIIVSVYLKYKYNKPQKQILEFDEVLDFDEESYMNDIFELIFKSIRSDSWSKSIDSTSISYIKKVDITKFHEKWVRLDISYVIKGGKFTIKDIIINKQFTFNGKLNDDDYKYFYDIYVSYKNNLNKINKDKCDESLKLIYSAIDKDIIRDSKIDDILN